MEKPWKNHEENPSFAEHCQRKPWVFQIEVHKFALRPSMVPPKDLPVVQE